MDGFIVDADVVEHVSLPPAREHLSPLAAALLDAVTLLARPCTTCTCPRALVGAADVDPDCPGLDRFADGCESDTHTRARLILTGAGIRIPASRRDQLRTVLSGVLHGLETAPGFRLPNVYAAWLSAGGTTTRTPLVDVSTAQPGHVSPLTAAVVTAA